MKTIMNENNQQQKEIEMEELQQLLKDVYEATKDIKQGKKEPFNVFELCGVWSTEMRHSAILRELLDPQGMHGFKTKFLEAFFNQIGLEFNPNGCSAKTEEAYSNGRMDIVISSGDVAVVIENKIYAGDQEDQLKRYKEEWLEAQSGKKQALLYLTLDGHEASNAEHVDYQRISYRNDILAWLETCIEIATKKPLVKSALEQYKELIKKLTGKDMDPKMEKDIANVVKKSNENYLAAALTAKAFDGIHQKIVRKIAEACTPEGMICDVSHCTSARFASFAYSFKSEKQYKLLFEFQEGNYHALYYGLHTKEKKDLLFLTKWNSGKRFEPPKGELDFYSTSPNNDGWIFSIKVSEDKFKNWDAESFAKRWKEQASNSKEKQPSLSEVKELFKKKLTTYINILLTFIEEDKKGNNFLRIDKSAN